MRKVPIMAKLLVITACALVWTVPAFAVLGEDVSSVQQDRVHLNASMRATPGQNYTIHELRSAAGIVLREYAAPSGKIFAVVWQSPTIPDMKQLLGSYFEEFQKAAQAQDRPGGHDPLIIRQPGLVVELGGHMRAHVGRAYLPDAVPSGVRVEEIK